MISNELYTRWMQSIDDVNAAKIALDEAIRSPFVSKQAYTNAQRGYDAAYARWEAIQDEMNAIYDAEEAAENAATADAVDAFVRSL